MARLAFKPDSSFFRKIVIGAVGARAVCNNLAEFGHDFVELERGSTNSKLWKDVKRKRVRIPDLLCINCGQRIECRAKTKTELSMSHSNEAERAWDFGMVDGDWIAFPVCEPTREQNWTNGRLSDSQSFWREKSWVQWRDHPYIDYFTVEAFRSRVHARSRTKDAVEGSENFISWNATFSTRSGPVLHVDASAGKVKIAKTDGSRPYTWRAKDGTSIYVRQGDTVQVDQIIVAAVPPIPHDQLACSGRLESGHIPRLLESRERTQRYTGVKLARLKGDESYADQALELARDAEEDVYVKLEAISYLVATCGGAAADLFLDYLASGDSQTQLEGVIALGETGTDEAVNMLARILCDEQAPYFLRSAAAWSLGQIGSEEAGRQLVNGFGCIHESVRSEALESIVGLGGTACEALLQGLGGDDHHIAAGCAEALRQQRTLPDTVIDNLEAHLTVDAPPHWAVWLIGNLPREQFNTAISELQPSKPELHYAVSLLWSFVESWIAKHWELNPSADFPVEREQDV